MLFWQERKAHFIALYQNARFPQVFYHGGLLLLGSLLAWHFEETALSLSLFSILTYLLLIQSVVLSWLASVILNDIHDTHIDTITNSNRPLIKNVINQSTYLSYGIIFFFFILLFAGMVSPTALILVFLYQVLAYVYSAPPLRLKRFPLLATALAAFANILILALGYITQSESKSLHTLPTVLILYLLLALTISLSLKDFKDIPSDAKDKVFTLPVILGEDLAKLVLGGLIFVIFALSPLILNQPSFLLLGLIAATLAYIIIQKGTSDKTSFFSYYRFSFLFFSLLFLYGCLLALLLFFKI